MLSKSNDGELALTVQNQDNGSVEQNKAHSIMSIIFIKKTAGPAKWCIG